MLSRFGERGLDGDRLGRGEDGCGSVGGRVGGVCQAKLVGATAGAFSCLVSG